MLSCNFCTNVKHNILYTISNIWWTSIRGWCGFDYWFSGISSSSADFKSFITSLRFIGHGVRVQYFSCFVCFFLIIYCTWRIPRTHFCTTQFWKVFTMTFYCVFNMIILVYKWYLVNEWDWPSTESLDWYRFCSDRLLL